MTRAPPKSAASTSAVRQTAARRVVGDRQAVNAATDDEQIEGRAGERFEIARAHARRFIL